MNEKFKELPEEKQMAIINSAMEVFAKNDYKRASTDLIAAKAGISKGLLFYYFHNKQELYLYIYNYASQIVRKEITDPAFFEITDFFELLKYGSDKKLELLSKNPFMLDFAMRSFYSEKETVSEELKSVNRNYIKEAFHIYFSHVDFSKFKDGTDPYQIYQMLIWMADGYLHQLQMQQISPKLPELENEFLKWSDFFKKISYKEDFL